MKNDNIIFFPQEYGQENSGLQSNGAKESNFPLTITCDMNTTMTAVSFFYSFF